MKKVINQWTVLSDMSLLNDIRCRIFIFQILPYPQSVMTVLLYVHNSNIAEIDHFRVNTGMVISMPISDNPMYTKINKCCHGSFK